ncbi:nitrate assimilation regulatory protein nira [Curvularia clavata]|uniref:Threonylcarbamoyl-AMP synthase n=1 Tax=Curvularia clavata TaxID=95742 RepID=A0A9Q8Z3Z5_CURCL|nr:nitrate assimilation regulatory protein nira [Curvularia clavata]
MVPLVTSRATLGTEAPQLSEKFWLPHPVITLMPKCPPRIPNVNSKNVFSYTVPIRRLAQVATRTRLCIPHSTLSAPDTFCRLGELSRFNSRHTTQTHKQFIATMAETRMQPVDPQKLGKITFKKCDDLIDDWHIEYDESAEGDDHFGNLKAAARDLVDTDIPVAFPTETVYGLGADATRSAAVKQIFACKGRPADNPLIVHVHSLPQLRALLSGKLDVTGDGKVDGKDPIPEIYRPLIERFWPGPLTLILPTPEKSILAPEVTAGLSTFGARMPRSIIALSLLRLCGRPLAAPSANASTRPSPTAAEHVYDDLDGKIRRIIDGGPCEVGVESTVVDGLSSPPAILRPGGITVEQLRQCPGWEKVVVGYKDKQAEDSSKPRAPGMKYRHYSPKAAVLLFEAGADGPKADELKRKSRIGIVRTKGWNLALGLNAEKVESSVSNGWKSFSTPEPEVSTDTNASSLRQSNLLRSVMQHQIPRSNHYLVKPEGLHVWDINLGANTEDIARGLFSALRDLDKKGVETIYVEGIDDKSGDDIAAAVMNRLRKAAEIRT